MSGVSHVRRAVGVVAALGALLLVTAGPAAASLGAPVPADIDAWLESRDGTVRVGWSAFPPMSVVDEQGEVTGGYAVEAWDLAALKLGFEVEHVLVGDLAEVVPALAAGEIDVAGGLGPREDVLASAVPSEPWAWAPVMFVGPLGLAGLAGFDGLTATTVPGSPLVDQLAATHPEVTYVPSASVAQGVESVIAGDVDLFFGPLALIGVQLQRLDAELVPIGEAVSMVEVGSWAIEGPAKELTDVARASITDDELRLLHVRWTGFDLTNPAAADPLPRWVLPVALGVSLVLLLALATAALLRRRVANATAQLHRLNAELEDTVDRRTAQLAESGARLRRSNKALQRFAATVAHDLRGPIAAIGGLAEIVTVMPLEQGEQSKVLTRIYESAVRLGRMVDAMLKDAVELGTGAGHIEGPAFEAWLREVTAPELHVIDGQLSVDVPDVTVTADAEVMRRAAINLVGNSVKYATNTTGVHIRVTVRKVGETWELRVDDNGPGIPQPMWGEVFERGSRLTHDERGFGLGLGAIRDTVQGAGGAIRLGDSDLGGAAFIVTLPIVVERDAADDLEGQDVASAT